MTIHNDNSTTSCWGSGKGLISADGSTISDLVCSAVPSCERHASGSVRAKTLLRIVNQDYVYAAGTEYTIVWDVVEGSREEGTSDEQAGSGADSHRWPDWKRTVMFDALVLQQQYQ